MANFYKKSQFTDDAARTVGKKKLQLGRSMIEMLGVLAIIGVLSIAGIAGYTKAMQKWRINKATQQIATVVANIKTLFINEKSYDELGLYEQNGQKLLALGIISPDMLSDKPIIGNDDIATNVVNPFKGGYWINSDWVKGKAFVVSMSGLYRDECAALAANDWLELGATVILVNGNDGDTVGDAGMCVPPYSDVDMANDDYVKACPNGKKVSIPIPAHIVAKACAKCNSYEAGCSLTLGFHD